MRNLVKFLHQEMGKKQEKRETPGENLRENGELGQMIQ